MPAILFRVSVIMHKLATMKDWRQQRRKILNTYYAQFAGTREMPHLYCAHDITVMNEYARNGHEYMTILQAFGNYIVPKYECVARCKRSACDPGQGWIVCACAPFA